MNKILEQLSSYGVVPVVVVNKKPKAIINTSAPAQGICETSYDLSANSVTGYNGKWTVEGTAGAYFGTDKATSATTANVKAENLQFGENKFRWTLTLDGNTNCEDHAEIIIKNDAAGDPEIVTTTEYTCNGTVELQAATPHAGVTGPWECKTATIDPADSKNAVVEIRGGTGGDEACIFAGDLFRMYSRFCEKKGWKIDIVDFNEGTAGGYKAITFNVTGEKAYGLMKYESGVHRVQRVPATETQGRLQTSTAAVVVLPEAEEFDVELNMADVRKDTFCASGPGGQCVNTTYSAVRLTHIPTGIVVSCQDQKSQIKNLEKAMVVLRTRLYEREYNKYMEEMSSKRKTLVATGDRSEKIRTYNYPQSRVTDHRIGYSIHSLPAFMDGDIEGMIEALQLAENAEKLKESVG